MVTPNKDRRDTLVLHGLALDGFVTPALGELWEKMSLNSERKIRYERCTGPKARRDMLDGEPLYTYSFDVQQPTATLHIL